MFNNLSVFEAVFHTYSAYLRTMPGTNKHIDNHVRYELLFAARACAFSKFSKKLNYFPTYKDFHN